MVLIQYLKGCATALTLSPRPSTLGFPRAEALFSGIGSRISRLDADFSLLAVAITEKEAVGTVVLDRP
jgi:hypothetical protein